MNKTAEKPTGLALLRVPFEAHQISKLPKPTKQQTEAVRADYKAGVRCEICGTWHHPKVVHLDYVGHAALTDRLLDADPNWNWEPVAVDEKGSPKLDENGGMWIRLTVCGVTRLGYGDAQGKTDGNAVKERIGDALRNAAMRFGAALDLWHKGDLHLDDEAPKSGPATVQTAVHSPTDGAFELLADGDKSVAKEVANSIVDLFADGKELTAYEKYYQSGHSNEIMLGAWELLKSHSKIRSTLKRMHQEAA